MVAEVEDARHSIIQVLPSHLEVGVSMGLDNKLTLNTNIAAEILVAAALLGLFDSAI